MRRFIVTCTLVAACVGLGAPKPAAGQDSGLTFDAPIVKIELSGTEPKPDGVADEMNFGGGGGGNHFLENPILLPDDNIPYWNKLPLLHDYPYLESSSVNVDTLTNLNSLYRTPDIVLADFEACGYGADSAPTALLTLPSGKTETPKPVRNNEKAGCWTLHLPWKNGMERGIYQLGLNHPRGELSHIWGVDYAFCPTRLELSTTPARSQRLFMGFAPNETLTFYFYQDTAPAGQLGYQQGGTTVKYMAARTVQVDVNGAALVDITIARSANFKWERVYYFYLSANKQFYGTEPHIFGFLQSNSPMEDPPENDNSGYVSHYETYEVIGDRCTDQLGGFAETLIPLQLYNTIGDTASPKETVEQGLPVQILERVPRVEHGRIVIWSHLRIEQGSEGWMVGNNLTPITRVPKEGALADVPSEKQFSNYEGTAVFTSDLKLYESPTQASAVIGVLKPGTQIRLIRSLFTEETYDRNAMNFWYIQTADGVKGWTAAPVQALPWKPLSKEELAAIDPQGQVATATASVIAAAEGDGCPTPSTRLKVGGEGRVMPPKPNRLRKTPGGEAIAKIAVGDTFKVLDGPRCTNDGLIWWNVDYQGTMGWTVEGSNGEYWVEPIQ